jgi:hypothetical protein
MLQEAQSTFVIVVLQITVGEKHPVKVNGLNDIYYLSIS